MKRLRLIPNEEDDSMYKKLDKRLKCPFNLSKNQGYWVQAKTQSNEVQIQRNWTWNEAKIEPQLSTVQSYWFELNSVQNRFKQNQLDLEQFIKPFDEFGFNPDQPGTIPGQPREGLINPRVGQSEESSNKYRDEKIPRWFSIDSVPDPVGVPLWRVTS